MTRPLPRGGARALPLLLLVLAGCAASPQPVVEATLEERPGTQVPLDLAFTDDRGQPVRLAELIPGDRPVLLTLAYVGCQTLCSLVLDGTARALLAQPPAAAPAYRAVTVSIDPRETPADVAAARARVLSAFTAGEPAGEWRFLVGAEPEIRALADAVGFRYRYERGTDQYDHPAVVTVLTPQGRVSSYLYGVEPGAEPLAAALHAAGEGRRPPVVERILLRCYHYIPALRRHAGLLGGLLRAAGALTLLGLGGLLARLWWRDLRQAGAR